MPNSVQRLAPADNIVIATRSLAADQEVRLENGNSCTLLNAVEIGHKIAARPIQAGEKIIKFDIAIGSATRDIAPGEHIHIHNMQSDYLPTYERGDELA